MSNFYLFGPDPTKPPGGGGPEDESRIALYQARVQGFIVIICGFAVGLTLLILSLLLNQYNLFNNMPTIKALAWWEVFLIGFIAGTIFSIIYNLLIVRRFNLFGYEREVD